MTVIYAEKKVHQLILETSAEVFIESISATQSRRLLNE